MDPATAKTLVSAALAAGVALFSAISFHALFAQVAAELRTARAAVRVPARRPARRPE